MVSIDCSDCKIEFIGYVLTLFHDYCEQTLKEETKLLLHTLSSYEEEMVVMVVMESLGLVDFQVGMGRMERRE